jgi:hypothetical protein
MGPQRLKPNQNTARFGTVEEVAEKSQKPHEMSFRTTGVFAGRRNPLSFQRTDEKQVPRFASE